MTAPFETDREAVVYANGIDYGYRKACDDLKRGLPTALATLGIAAEKADQVERFRAFEDATRTVLSAIKALEQYRERDKMGMSS